VLTVTFYGRAYASGTFAQIAQRSGVTPGAVVSTTWNGLGQGQRFEWYVVSDTGSSSSRSALRTFSTASGPDPVLVGAGDIARCDSTGDEASGAVLSGVAGQVFTTGDNAYINGTAADFAACYDPSWGHARSRTRPVPGNREWNSGSLAGYFGYFGAAATDGGGLSYYSYDISARWHAVVVDSECIRVGGCGPGSPQDVWLRSDLAAHADDNVVVLWHKPRFSSGPNSSPEMQRFTEDLYAAGVDLLLAGHDHIYERFAPLDPSGAVDLARGVPMITVGTGGAEHHQITGVLPGSRVRNNDTYGVLKLTLHADSFDWEFLPEDGRTFTDRGSSAVHEAPAAAAPAMDSVSISPTQPRTADTLTATARGTDPSGLSLTYDYQWLRNGVAIVGATGTSLDLGAPGAGDRGDQVSVRARAFNGSTWSAPLTAAAVTVGDTAPVVAPVANQTTVQGTQASLSLSATDADGDALHYAATGLPAGLVLDGATGRITGAPAAGSSGTYSVTVSVDDGALSSSTSFSWQVTAADGP